MPANYGRNDLARSLAEDAGITLATARKMVDKVLHDITVNTLIGTQVRLADFGTFQVVERAARAGRNPRTNEVVEIAAKSAVKFKPARQFSK